MRPYLGLLCCVVIFGAVLLNAQTGDDNPKWEYGRIPDKMSDRDTLYAHLESLDGMNLTVERNRSGLTVYIYFLDDNDRLFFCNHRCVVEMRFDKGKIERWPAIESSSHDEKTLHFENPETLIARLKTAHRLVMEPPVFQHNLTFEFFVDGLQWPPPAWDAKGLPINKDAIAKAAGSPPACYYSPNPPISAEASEAHYRGTVSAQGTVSKDGSVQEIKILRSPGLGIDEVVTATMKAWRCKPAVNANGEPVSATISLEFHFDWLAGSSTVK